MLHLQRASSAERSFSSSSSSNTNKPKMGAWWSLAPPSKLYKCSFCSMSFDNLKALGGHQNAHRQERSEMQNLIMNYEAPTGEEIDLELRLGCGPPPNPNQKPFYEFLPLKKEGLGLYGYGASRAPSGGVGNKHTRHHAPTSRYYPYVPPAAYNGQPRHQHRRELPFMNDARRGRFQMGSSLSGGWGGGGFLEASASSPAIKGKGLTLFPGLLEEYNTAVAATSASVDDLDLTLKL